MKKSSLFKDQKIAEFEPMDNNSLRGAFISTLKGNLKIIKFASSSIETFALWYFILYVMEKGTFQTILIYSFYGAIAAFAIVSGFKIIKIAKREFYKEEIKKKVEFFSTLILQEYKSEFHKIEARNMVIKYLERFSSKKWEDCKKMWSALADESEHPLNIFLSAHFNSFEVDSLIQRLEK